MARIAGVELQDNWKVDFALTRIRGIGWHLARKLTKEAKGVAELSKKRMKDLTAEEIATISKLVESYPTEGDLYRVERGNVQRLQTIGSYRGSRHSRNLPVRGQRTRTNARTKRGKRKTVGAFKKEVLTKQTTGASAPEAKKE